MIFVLFMTAGLSIVGMASASAAPAAGQVLSNTAARSAVVIRVSGGCGPHRHRDRHGHCRHD
jgi:crotonobetainyl-CoA:carnitine CoA-transferase CaiB-like acyl-CoA transferase